MLKHVVQHPARRNMAYTVINNTTDAWVEQQMLVKCVLCAPPRGGAAHKNQRMSWTRSRMKRWLAGERGQLWESIPTYNTPCSKRGSEKRAKALQHQRCISLCGEGGYSNGDSCIMRLLCLNPREQIRLTHKNYLGN